MIPVIMCIAGAPAVAEHWRWPVNPSGSKRRRIELVSGQAAESIFKIMTSLDE